MAQSTAPAPPAPFAAVSGIVLNDVTGAPIHRAVVTLSTLDDTPLEAVTFSESNGLFGFHTIPPGQYRLRVDLDGFQEAWFGASTSNRPPGTLNLAAGDIRYGITFRLKPLGSVSGVVLDADGDPIADAQVRLLKAAWERLQPAYRTQGWATTDDRGRYRFEDVVSGQYLVMAGLPYGQIMPLGPEAVAGQTTAQRMYAAEFYPDASRLSAAVPLRIVDGVAPAKHIEGIDFHLTTRTVAVLRGKVVVPGDLPANTNVLISVYPQDIPDGQSIGFGAFQPNYDFEINQLIAGSYVIGASFSLAGRDYRAAERIELPPGGQEITLHPDRAIDLTGRVDLEGGQPPAGPFRVTLVPGGYPPGRSQIGVEAQPDGTFTLPNVVPGIWDINVAPVPLGGYIKAMRLGERDVFAEDMTIEPDTREPLQIVVSGRAAAIAGTVKVPDGVPRSGRASVLLAPCGKYAHVLSLYALATAGDAGHFEFKGVTPGRYKLYAFEELDPSAYEDPGFLKPFAALGEAIDVTEGARMDVQPSLILAGTRAAERN